jgi:hypothetical protein
VCFVGPWKIVANLPEWAIIEKHYRAFAVFLGDADFRGRAKVSCVVVERSLWKWECVNRFLITLIPMIPMLARDFDRRAILRGGNGRADLSDVNAAILTAVEDALKHAAEILSDSLLIQMVAWPSEREAAWFEGCPCRERILHSGKGAWRWGGIRHEPQGIGVNLRGCRVLQ